MWTFKLLLTVTDTMTCTGRGMKMNRDDDNGDYYTSTAKPAEHGDRDSGRPKLDKAHAELRVPATAGRGLPAN